MPDWEKRYASTAAPFGDAPNDYVQLVANRPDFGARSALCLADGDGRNGTWLATRGLSVTAVDLSTKGTERALARDMSAGVQVERISADVACWKPKTDRKWGSAFVIYLQSDQVTRQRAVQLASSSLEPGGWLVLEAFARPAADRPGPGPGDPSVLYDLAEIESWTPELEIVESLEGQVMLDEGPRHQGLAAVVRFAARRKR